MLRVLFILAVSIFAVSAKAGDMPHIAEWPNQILPLKVGDHTPDAILWTGNGDPIHLRKLLKKKPTVLLFYQGNWSPECSDQLADIRIEADVSSVLPKVVNLVSLSHYRLPGH